MNNKSCDFCDYCKSCNFCKFCDSCKNLVNGFMCINMKFDEKDNTKYWIFNKEVTKKEWKNRFNLTKEDLKEKENER